MYNNTQSVKGKRKKGRTTMKKTITTLLLTAMLLSTMASCGGDKPVETETSAAGNDTETTAGSTETETAGETELQPDIPALDFDGATFTFLTSGDQDENGSDWVTYDVWVESTNGEAINDAVYTRNAFLEDTYKCKLAEQKSSGKTLDEERLAVTSDSGEFDAAFTNISANVQLAQEGLLLDLTSVPYIDLKKPWWDQRAVEDLSIGKAMYFGTGDITVIDNDATWVLMFNKAMHENLSLDNIYSLVREGKWTNDAMLKMCEAAAADVNGDGTRTWQSDNFGLATTGMTILGLFYSTGEKLTARDSDGYPILTPDTGRMADAIFSSARILSNANLSVVAGIAPEADVYAMETMFEEGRALFYGEVMQCITRMRGSDTDFGLIPWPKLDEAQSGYYNLVHATAAKAVNIPATQRNPEMAGALLEAMAAKSMYTLTPAYFDVSMTYKYMRDEESAEMLSIILGSRCFDLGYIYNWGDMCWNVAEPIATGDTGTFASTWETFKGPFEAALNTTIVAYKELENR